jgi:hypothetical protein
VTCADELIVPPATGRLPLPAVVGDAQAGWADTFIAVIVTVVEEVTDGAVNRPVLVIEPALACHTTAVFGVEVSVATNCSVAPEEMVVREGVRAILAEELGLDVTGLEDGARPPQPVKMQARAERKRAIPECLKKAMDAAFSRSSGGDTKNIVDSSKN